MARRPRDPVPSLTYESHLSSRELFIIRISSRFGDRTISARATRSRISTSQKSRCPFYDYRQANIHSLPRQRQRRGRGQLYATKTISFWLAGALQIREEQRGSRGVCP